MKTFHREIFNTQEKMPGINMPWPQPWHPFMMPMIPHTWHEPPVPLTQKRYPLR